MNKPFPENQWPYPRWIAHRGAGLLAPENTLAAFRAGAALGYRMFECDVKLSADDVPFLLHDDTLERTTNAVQALAAGTRMVAGQHPWSTLAALDAGSWLATRFAGEPMPTLAAVAGFCLDRGLLLNIEIKPTTGSAYRTGQVVAHHAARLWQDAPVAPLLTSFEIAALQGAQQAQPHLPRGLLLEEPSTGWVESALQLGCIAVVCPYEQWDGPRVAQARAAGLRVLSYTVNDECPPGSVFTGVAAATGCLRTQPPAPDRSASCHQHPTTPAQHPA